MPETTLGSFYFRHTAQDFLREQKKSHQSGKLTVRETSRNGHTWFEIIYTTEADLGQTHERRPVQRLVLEQSEGGRAVLRDVSALPSRSVGRPAMGGPSAREWDTAADDRRRPRTRRRDGGMGEDE